jgi:hypothetical protein
MGIISGLSAEEEKRLMFEVIQDIGNAWSDMMLPTIAFDVPSIRENILKAKLNLDRLV